MAKKTPADKLSEAIKSALQEYTEDVSAGLGKAVSDVTKKGAQAVKSAAKQSFGGSGKYGAGWTSKVETTRLSTSGVIYNKTLPGLPHLLEHGHAKRGGGRTPGREHIAPVEEQIAQEFEEEVKKNL